MSEGFPVTSELLRDAGRLLALGLSPTRRPSSEPDYARLLRRWLDDPLLERVATVATLAPEEGPDRYQRGLELLALVGEHLGRAAAAQRAAEELGHRLAAAKGALAGRRWPPIYLAALFAGGVSVNGGTASFLNSADFALSAPVGANATALFTVQTGGTLAVTDLLFV